MVSSWNHQKGASYRDSMLSLTWLHLQQVSLLFPSCGLLSTSIRAIKYSVFLHLVGLFLLFVSVSFVQCSESKLVDIELTSLLTHGVEKGLSLFHFSCVSVPFEKSRLGLYINMQSRCSHLIEKLFTLLMMMMKKSEFLLFRAFPVLVFLPPHSRIWSNSRPKCMHGDRPECRRWIYPSKTRELVSNPFVWRNPSILKTTSRRPVKVSNVYSSAVASSKHSLWNAQIFSSWDPSLVSHCVVSLPGVCHAPWIVGSALRIPW